MIQYTAEIIKRILQDISPEEILSGKVDCKSISLAKLKRISFVAEENLSEPSIEKKLEYLLDWVVDELQGSDHLTDIHRYGEKQVCCLSFFDLVECLAEKVLTFVDGEIVYKYKYLEIWHEMASKIGTDLVVADAYAFHDFKFGFHRNIFNWKTILSHDNYSLKNILDRGVSDNHYHLRCSIPYFDLSWISLMNSAEVQQKMFQHLEQMDQEPRNIRKRYVSANKEEGFVNLHLKAVLLRVYLYSLLSDQLIQLSEYPVKMEWLLRSIIEIENPEQYLCKLDMNPIDVSDEKDLGSFQTYLKKIENRGACTLAELKDYCPGFYWFFLELFPDIPIDLFTDKKHFLSKENIQEISRYLEKNYEKPPLRNCRWLFQGKDYEKYRMEWKRQTRKTVWRLLQEPDLLIASRSYLQSVLTGLHYTKNGKYKDYILADSLFCGLQMNEETVLYGERWFLYIMFMNRYHPVSQELEDNSEVYNLFFTYLLIKERFRLELLYNNEKIGFDNFHNYQSRKGWFTTRYSEAELARSAVRAAFCDANLQSLELRIMPGECCRDNIRNIQYYDKAILEGWDKSYLKKYYYVFHFAKEKEKNADVEKNLMYRNERLCIMLRKKANAILRMREQNRDVGRRLLGVDACSSEDGCRPETFAVSFRVLKNHVVEENAYKEKMPQLRLSYHVGEDNQDVLDGIRAIDEAIFFLNMESGDRLGHATMLGVDALEWYYRNNYTISIRQQDYLDNVVWLYYQIVRYHLPNEDNLLEYLEREFYTYFERIYREALNKEYDEIEMRECDIYNYYSSWELRGDNPQLYKTGEYAKCTYYNIWDDYGINPKVKKEKRKMKKAAALYHAYHYSARVRSEGGRSIVVKIPIHMVRGIQAVQKEMMRMIAENGIFIETNPTSNVLIAGLNGYGNHPIVNFYNKALTDNKEELNCCYQIHASINTDDPGVFMTSLSNEYALMAKSLESMCDKTGQKMYKKDRIYDWLDEIREMGNEQSFLDKM